MVGAYYAVILIFFLANTMVLADTYEDEEDDSACEELFNYTITDFRCCNSKVLFDDSSEPTNCYNLKDEEDLSCDDYKCLLEESDLLIGDQINEDKVHELLDALENKYPTEKQMIDSARRECLGGKYLEYIDEENCVPVKFYTCLYINAIIECQSWDKDPRCTKAEEYAEKCKELLDSK